MKRLAEFGRFPGSDIIWKVIKPVKGKRPVIFEVQRIDRPSMTYAYKHGLISVTRREAERYAIELRLEGKEVYL